MEQLLLTSTFLHGILTDFASYFVSHPWLCWGVGPPFSAFFGYMSVTLFCEWAVDQPWCEKYLIVYGKKMNRWEETKKTQEKVSWKLQFLTSLWTVGGPINCFGALFLYFVFPILVGNVSQTPLPKWEEFLLHFSILALIADLGLYWGHRIQHMSSYLWENCHSIHHRLQTPTSASTAYIEGRDAFLQSALPLLIASLAVRPHPITLCLYFWFHLGNNAWNHSGIHCWWMDLFNLKWLPFRCRNTLHDAHHRFSGYGPNSKNFAEMFWIWDYVFGTLSQTEKLATTSSSRHDKDELEASAGSITPRSKKKK